MRTVLTDMSLPRGKLGVFRIARSGRRMLRQDQVTLDRLSQDPDAPPAASQPAGPMANPAAAAPGRVAVLGEIGNSEGLLTSIGKFANMAGDAEIRVWPGKPKNEESTVMQIASTARRPDNLAMVSSDDPRRRGASPSGLILVSVFPTSCQAFWLSWEFPPCRTESRVAGGGGIKPPT